MVATADGLSEIVTSVSIPRHPQDAGQDRELASELLYGGSIERRRQPYDGYFQNVVVLPRPLRAGERHEYAMRLTIPAGQRMTPHYVHVPYRRSDYFELRVRFNPDRLPECIWILRDAPAALIYQGAPTAETVTPDRFGEITDQLPRHAAGSRLWCPLGGSRLAPARRRDDWSRPAYARAHGGRESRRLLLSHSTEHGKHQPGPQQALTASVKKG